MERINAEAAEKRLTQTAADVWADPASAPPDEFDLAVDSVLDYSELITRASRVGGHPDVIRDTQDARKELAEKRAADEKARPKPTAEEAKEKAKEWMKAFSEGQLDGIESQSWYINASPAMQAIFDDARFEIQTEQSGYEPKEEPEEEPWPLSTPSEDYAALGDAALEADVEAEEIEEEQAELEEFASEYGYDEEPGGEEAEPE